VDDDGSFFDSIVTGDEVSMIPNIQIKHVMALFRLPNIQENFHLKNKKKKQDDVGHILRHSGNQSQ
jgi:hypothetical protein